MSAAGPTRLQAVDHEGLAARPWLAWAGWVAILGGAFWIGRLSTVWLLLAGAGTLLYAYAVGASRSRSRLPAFALAALAILLGAGTVVQARLWEVAHHWPRVKAAAEESAEAALGRALNDLVDRGERAVRGAATALPTGTQPSAGAFSRLDAVRRATAVSALAVYGPAGTPLVWAGEHRGMVPDSVRSGAREYTFSDGPLFGYLYFARPLGEGRTAVAAVLLSASVSVREGRAPFAERFAARHGLTPRFTLPERARGDAVWDWKMDHSILSVSFATLTQERWRDRVADRGRWAAIVAWAAAFLLLGAAWYHWAARPSGVPVVVGTAGLLLIPWAELLDAAELFSPARFVLPLPGDLPLGDLLLLLGGATVWLLMRGVRLPHAPLAARVVLATGAIPLLLELIRRSAAEGLLAERPAGGIALLLATALLVTLSLLLLFPRRPGSAPRRADAGHGTGYVAAGVLASVALAVGWVAGWQPEQPIPLGFTALWALPFGLFAAALTRSRSRRSPLLAALAAGWIAGSVALPVLWTLHLEARLAEAEAELSRTGTEADPFLDYLLRKFAEDALTLDAQGETGVNLLYRSWVASGLAAAGYEARLTLWGGGEPTAELRLSEVEVPPALLPEMLQAAHTAEAPVLERYTQLDSVHYLLSVPLPDERVLSVVVPPRRRLGRATALARFLEPTERSASEADLESLSLIPISAGAEHGGVAIDDTSSRVAWTRTPAGWRSEANVHFPAGPMHAHLLVRTPSGYLLAVRGLLVQALLLALLTAAWALAHTLRGEPFWLPERSWRGLRSFRGRLTLALFTFFLFPTLAFGAVAYGAFSREVVRTAAAVARWSLERAVPEPGLLPLAPLARRVGTDLLLYRDGVLVDAAAPEVRDLGLFHTWLDPDLYLGFARGEDTEALAESRLGSSDYLVAYRRTESGAVLALPTPLAAGEIARRQRELADTLLLTTLLGAGLSIVLSLLVGRALSQPIEQLRRAAAVVGGGNLRVRLPERRHDEFGGVYRAFNRMVRRLRQTRAELVRETRRTEAIVAEAGTGVLALDREGRVALANPRAAAILGAPLVVGRPLPVEGPVLEEVARLVDAFWRTGSPEAGKELEIEGRVLRVRLRRLPTEHGPAGAVLALEDITDEIRTARVLAWGEMARQIAHEIKNPLTPIKLSVQHLRRAHADGRADFAQILDRNVDAVLREIDRLSEIARAFARFGTPAQDGGAPEAVHLEAVVKETLALYRGGRDGIEYAVSTDGDIPLVRARVGELKEVLVNLLENAREALAGSGGGGTIRITAALADDGCVRLELADTGEGIPAELLPRVFDPQFSTRSSGTGLGLAIVRRLVESWGGVVTAESVPGVGTTIRLLLRTATG